MLPEYEVGFNQPCPRRELWEELHWAEEQAAVLCFHYLWVSCVILLWATLGGGVLVAALCHEVSPGPVLAPSPARFPCDCKAGGEVRWDCLLSYLSFLCNLRAAGHCLCHKHKWVFYKISLNLQAVIINPEQGEEMERGWCPAGIGETSSWIVFPTVWLSLSASGNWSVLYVSVRASGCVKCSGKVRNLIFPSI